MSLLLYAHPFSSYCQKVLIALYENETPFSLRMLAHEDAAAAAELATLWPMKRFPVLVDNGAVIPEATIIIDHLGLYHPGPVQLVPIDAKAALDVRFMDRFFDNYVMAPMMKIVFDHIRAPANRDAQGVAEARAMLDTAYRWLDARMARREWASGDDFSLADCAAAPALFYADWVHPVGEELASVRRYRRRLLARPSFARAVDEARPYRSLFPLGAPERD
jgi:glutathione S-transferase